MRENKEGEGEGGEEGPAWWWERTGKAQGWEWDRE